MIEGLDWNAAGIAKRPITINSHIIDLATVAAFGPIKNDTGCSTTVETNLPADQLCEHVNVLHGGCIYYLNGKGQQFLLSVAGCLHCLK